jgi:UDP-N-acetylglucosamine transferase subunit ALG13
MIFITTGTSLCAFQRLVDVAVPLAEQDEVVVQHGTAEPPRGVIAFAYAPEAVIGRFMRDADVVVCHGGVGSTALALSVGRRPIVLPRRAEFGENIDNHQVAFAERLSRDGLVALCSNADEILRQSSTNRTPIAPLVGPSPRLVAAIREAIEASRPTACSGD